MAEPLQIAVFEGGSLSFLQKSGNGREAMLALHLDRILVRMVRIPPDSLDDPEAFALPLLKEISPFPDEPLKVSCETVSEDENGRTAIAAALPEGSCDDIGEALDGAGTGITRIDAAALGALRSLWPHIAGEGDWERRAILLPEDDTTALFIMDGNVPAEIRAIANGPDMKREFSFSLFAAEEFAGAKPLKEIVALSGVDTEGLDLFAPIRIVEETPDVVAGLEERARENSTLDILPESWREVLEETRFKRKMKHALIGAFAVWALLIAAMFAAPIYFQSKKNNIEKLREQHRQGYSSVRERKEQVEAVRSVSNHDQGALETLRVVSASMPDNTVLSKWTFKRGDRLSFSGSVDNGDHNEVYLFKDALTSVPLSQISGDEDDEKPFFASVELPRGVTARGSKAVFDVECSFKEDEEDE